MLELGRTVLEVEIGLFRVLFARRIVVRARLRLVLGCKVAKYRVHSDAERSHDADHVRQAVALPTQDQPVTERLAQEGCFFFFEE